MDTRACRQTAPCATPPKPPQEYNRLGCPEQRTGRPLWRQPGSDTSRYNKQKQRSSLIQLPTSLMFVRKSTSFAPSRSAAFSMSLFKLSNTPDLKRSWKSEINAETFALSFSPSGRRSSTCEISSMTCVVSRWSRRTVPRGGYLSYRSTLYGGPT